MNEGLLQPGMKLDFLGNPVPDLLSVSTPEIASSNLTALKNQQLGLGGSIGGTQPSLDIFGNAGAKTLGVSDDLWGGLGTAAQLGLGFMNYKDSHAMNKKNMEGMDQNIAASKQTMANNAAEAEATRAYRASYGA